MRRRVSLVAIILAMTAVAAVGCFSFADLSGGGADGGAPEGGACAADQKYCGACVSIADPNVGCGGSCNACPAAVNAQSACKLENGTQACALGDCNAQFGNCDNDPSNGCETHTTTNANCGACGTDCLQEFCERQGSGYACSATCDSPNITCGPDAGVECVDPTTDIANCGGCGTNCAVANGVGSCNGGTCSIQCNVNYVLCGGACVVPSASQCGASCAPCTEPDTCDTNPVSKTYGTCVAPQDSGATCATHLCGSVCCASSTDLCCPSSPDTCTPESNSACGPNCDSCSSGAVCGAHACTCLSSGYLICHADSQYWCCPNSDTCGATSGSCMP